MGDTTVKILKEEHSLNSEEHELGHVLHVPLGRGAEGVRAAARALRRRQLLREQRAHRRVELHAAPHQLGVQQRRLRALLGSEAGMYVGYIVYLTID